MKLEVFDPAMCCSTGVCGPNPNPALAPFAADLDWVAAQGIAVRRYNLGQEPGAFVEHEAVKKLLQDQGEAALPIVMANGAVRSTGRYPSRSELGGWLGLAATPMISAALIAELASIGAAVGANCEPCLEYHYNKALELGLTRGDLEMAVGAAQTVKDVPARKMIELAGKLLDSDAAKGTAASSIVAIEDITDVRPADAGACCGGDAAAPCCGEAENVKAAAGHATADRCC